MRLTRWARVRPYKAVDLAKEHGLKELAAESNVSDTLEV